MPESGTAQSKARVLLSAYHVSEQEQADVRRATQTLRRAEQAALEQFVPTLEGLMDGPFPRPEFQQRFDALLVQLGQRLREHLPDLADPDDEGAWVRLALAYAFGPQEN